MTTATNYPPMGTTPSDAPAAAGAEPALRVRLTLEVALYIGLALLAAALRLAQLGADPLPDAEAFDALAAYRAVFDTAPGPDLVPASPLTYALRAVTFSLVDGGGTGARLPVALGGVALALAPALWRRYVNPLPPLIMSLLLTLSPVALLAARTSSAVTWTMLLAVLAPWWVLRAVETRRRAPALLATAALVSMLLLAEPAGFLTLIALGFGVLFAWMTDDDPANDFPARWRALLRGWPWADGLVMAGLTVLVVGTGFFWLPQGLTAVGNALGDGVAGFWQRTPGAPVAFPLWISLRYEPALLLFGLLASVRAIREGGFFERALVGWFVLGVVWSLVYAGAEAGHALWLTLPLSALIALQVTLWLTERPDGYWRVPEWGVPLHAAVTAALWVAVGMTLLLLAKRLLVDLPLGVTDFDALARALFEGIYNRSTADPDVITIQEQPVFSHILYFIQLRLLIAVMLPLLIGVLFFLVGSIWGARAAWRGLALGTLAYLLAFGWGLGGRAALHVPGDPRELWYPDPVTDDVGELRATLREMSLRATGEPRLISVAALVPDDGALAWALRDYPNTLFVNGVGPEINTGAVLMPYTSVPPRMGADYIGKDLVIRQTWDLDSLSWRDALMWYYNSDTQMDPLPETRLQVWIRSDIYGVEQVE